MSEFKGTPGPWEAVRISRGEDLKVIVKGSLKKSPGMRLYTPITDEVENKHNANLIAAAPELLEALQWMKMALNSGTAMDIAIGQEKADAAIAKALGQ